MNLWSLDTPPQLAADSNSEDTAQSWNSISIPARADGEQPKHVLVTWEGDSMLWIRGNEATGYGWSFPSVCQPILLAVLDRAGQELCFWMDTGTSKVHITPLEE